MHIPRCTFCRSPRPRPNAPRSHQRHFRRPPRTTNAISLPQPPFTPPAASLPPRTIPAAHHSLRAEPLDQGFHPAVASPRAQSPLKGFHLPSRGRNADERPSINQRDPLPSIAIPFLPSQSTLAHSIAQSPLPHPWLQSVAPAIPFHPWRGRWLFSTVNRQHSLDLNPFAIRSCPSLAAQSIAQTSLGLHLREEPRLGRGAGARSLLFLAPPLLRDPLLERGHGRRPLRLLRRRDGGPVAADARSWHGTAPTSAHVAKTRTKLMVYNASLNPHPAPMPELPTVLGRGGGNDVEGDGDKQSQQGHGAVIQPPRSAETAPTRRVLSDPMSHGSALTGHKVEELAAIGPSLGADHVNTSAGEVDVENDLSTQYHPTCRIVVLARSPLTRACEYGETGTCDVLVVVVLACALGAIADLNRS